MLFFTQNIIREVQVVSVRLIILNKTNEDLRHIVTTFFIHMSTFCLLFNIFGFVTLTFTNMFKLRLKFILESKGIVSPYKYMIKNGFTPNTTLRYINGQVDLMNLAYLEKLCLMLQCTPHDLLEWVPSDGTTVSEDHPLNALIRKDKAYDIVSHINKLSLSEIKKVQEYIEQFDKKEDGK